MHFADYIYTHTYIHRYIHSFIHSFIHYIHYIHHIHTYIHTWLKWSKPAAHQDRLVRQAPSAHSTQNLIDLVLDFHKYNTLFARNPDFLEHALVDTYGTWQFLAWFLP